MASNITKNGPNLSMDEGLVTVFESKGFVQGDNWVLNAFMGAFIEVEPAPVVCEIESCLANDYEAGNAEKIKHIVISPKVAVRLFLEGKLTKSDIVAASTSVEGQIVFPGVLFAIPGGERSFRVIVEVDTKHSFATIDENGEVV